MTLRDGDTGDWLDDGRKENIRIILSLPARQDVEFRTLDLILALGQALDDKFGEALQYEFHVED